MCGVRFDDRTQRCPMDATALVEAPDPLVGRMVHQRYQIEALLGSGGMATVYRGRHQLINRQVALKFLKPKQATDATARARFLREARALNQVQHEHIVDVSDFGETDDGLVYMVMEYLEGRTLTVEIAKGPLSLGRACRIGLQLAQALASAHEHGIVHRDVKPANIFLIQRGDDPDFVKLLDFGLARGADDVTLTASNLLFGTPEYMAPEQVRGALVGPHTDLYALGCVLFEMVTGRLPFEGAPTEVIYRHLYDLPPRPSSLRSEIPPELERLVLQLLSKDSDKRPSNAEEVAKALLRMQGLFGRPRTGSGELPRHVDDPAAEQHSTRSQDHGELALNQLQNRVAARYRNVPPPAQVAEGLRRVSQLVREAQALKQDLSGLESSPDTTVGRSTQMRIGSAIESLEVDAAQADTALEHLADEQDSASEHLSTAINQLLQAWGEFETADDAQSPRVHNLVEPLRTWASAQRAHDALEERICAQQAVRADLGQQIAQLKHRLLDLDTKLQPTVAKAAELQLELSTKLAAIRDEAGRVTEQMQRESKPA